MQRLLLNCNLLENNKLKIPKHLKRVKLDAGLSYSAPISQHWLEKEKDLLVFGFEPRESNIKTILNGAKKININHSEPLNIKYINTQFFLIPCGLSNEEGERNFFHAWDLGTGSLYEPNSNYNRNNTGAEIVKIFTLNSFLDFFPFETIPFIEYLKLDTQGSDLDILKGATKYLDKIAYITVECMENDSQYKNVTNKVKAVEAFLIKYDFERIYHSECDDPTFVNRKYKNKSIYIWQRG